MLKSVLCSYGYSCVLILAVFVVLCCGCERPEGDELSERIIGVKIYKHDGNFNDLFREFRTLGINTVFCSVELYSKPEFGKLARQHGISAFIILPIFFDADTLEQNPNLFAITSRGQQARHDWVTFVCPSRQSYREQKIRNIVDLVKVLEPDGITHLGEKL